jgi:hypothetical protein
MKRPLPQPGDRIHCDPNREDGDVPHRWANVNRASAIVLDVLDDDGFKIIVIKQWSKRKQYWRYRAEDETWWEICTSWVLGPLPQPPKGKP